MLPSNMFLLLIVAAAATGKAENPPTGEELAEKALAARAKVVTGQVRLEVHDAKLPPGDPKAQGGTGTFACEVAFDDGKLRCDIWKPAVANPGAAEGDWTIEKCVRTDEERIHWSTATSRGLPTAVSIYREKQRLRMTRVVIDAFAIGFYVNSTHHLHGCNLDASLIRQPVKDVTRAKIDGHECWKVEYELRNGSEGALWIAPSLGFSVVRGEVSAAHAKGRIKDSIECKVRHFPDADVWFPSLVTYCRHVGDRLVIAEDTDIKNVRLNQKIPPDTFTLAGLGLPKGLTAIEYPPAPIVRVWNGSELVEAQAGGK